MFGEALTEAPTRCVATAGPDTLDARRDARGDGAGCDLEDRRGPARAAVAAAAVGRQSLLIVVAARIRHGLVEAPPEPVALHDPRVDPVAPALVRPHGADLPFAARVVAEGLRCEVFGFAGFTRFGLQVGEAVFGFFDGRGGGGAGGVRRGDELGGLED